MDAVTKAIQVIPLDSRSIKIRRAIGADAPAIVRIHFAAVQVTAASAYPPIVITTWSPPPDEQRFMRIRGVIESGEELFVLAEIGEIPCGFGVIVPSSAEVRAVYVDPALGRRGIGSVILKALEQLAMARGLKELQLDAATNAEAFYAKHGYSIVSRGTHRLEGGVEMACVHMRKAL